MEQNFCVYLHLQADASVVFYVGKGVKKRPYDFRYRTSFWKRVAAKHGVEVLVVEDNLTEGEAVVLEKRYIKWFGRRNIGTGTLVNFTDGGEGASGLVQTPEHKAKKVASHKATINDPSSTFREKMRMVHLGKPKSDEQRMNMSKSRKGVPWTEAQELAGRTRKVRAPHSEETRAKIGKAHKGRVLSAETRAKISASRKALFNRA